MAVQYCNYDIKGTLAVSGNATFAGVIHTTKDGGAVAAISTPRVRLRTDGVIDWGATYNAGQLTWDSNYAFVNGLSGKGLKFATNGSTLALTLDTSQNATFAKRGLFSDNVQIVYTGSKTNDAALYIENDESDWGIHVNKNTTNFGVRITSDGGNAFSIYSDAGVNKVNISGTGNATFAGDLTVSGGDITLGGTGRIQGVDTVSATTDAANKAYVDSAVAGAGSGTFLPLAGGTMSGDITLSTDADILKAGTNPFRVFTNGTQALSISASQNATFAGSVMTVPGTIEMGGNWIIQGTDGSYFQRIKTIDSSGTDAETFSFDVKLGSAASYKQLLVLNQNDSIGGTFLGNLTVSGGNITLGGTGRIQGVDTVSASTDAANKAYVDAHVSPAGTYLPLAGGTMSGNIVMGNNDISGVRGLGVNSELSVGVAVASKTFNYGAEFLANGASLQFVYGRTGSGEGKGAIGADANSIFSVWNVDSGASEKFRMDKNGVANFSNTIFMPSEIYHVGDSDTFFGFHGDNLWRVVTGGSERLEVSNSGLKLGNTGVTVSSILDQNDLGSDSDTALATQQSIKAYVDAQIQTIPSGLNFQGNWDANANSPALASGTGTPGFYYNVSVAGNTNLDGETDWEIGDWAVFVENGANDFWEKIDNTSALTGVGVSGRVTFWDGTNTLVSDGDFTYNSSTNVLTVDGHNSTQWSSAYQDTITAFSATSGSTTVLTLTQRDGGTITTSFVNPQGNVTTSGFTSGRVPFANTATNLDNSANLTFDGSKLTIGQPVQAAGVLNTAGQVYIERQGIVWSETTPGTGRGAIHMDPVGSGANNTGNAITFGASDSSAGSTGMAGIYTRSDGAYGTRMYIATTDSYASGSKTAITIDNTGAVAINRSHLTINTITNASSDTDKFLVTGSSGQVQYRTGAQVLSDIGAASSGSLGDYLPLAGGTLTGALAGTSATFSGNVTATNILTVAGAATGNPFLQFTQAGAQKAYIQYADTGDSFELQTDNQFIVRTGGSTVAFTINSSQYATFAGNMSVGAINATGTLDISSTYPRINLNDTNSEDDWSIINDDGAFSIFNVDDNVHALVISQGNNSSFAGNLTINGPITTFNPDADSRLRILNAGTNAIAVFAEVGDTLYLGGNNTTGMTLDVSANATFAGDITVTGGDISLGGTGRIQGVDTVTDGTDAANKDYVDTAVGAVPVGTVTSVSSSTTSQLTVSQSSPAPALSIVTGAVTNGGTALATGDQIYDATSARLTSYLNLAGGTMVGNINMGTNRIIFGSNHLKIYNDGTDSYLENVSGDMYIMQRADNADMSFQNDNGAGGDAEYFRLDGGSELTFFSKALQTADNAKIFVGNAGDLAIYHDGSNSKITEAGQGDLFIGSNFLGIQNSAHGTYMAKFDSNGAAELYYNNSKKFETTVNGIALPQGGSANPSISRDGDNNTGMYWGASDELNFSTAGINRLIIDSNGLTVNGNVSLDEDVILGASSSIVLDDTPTASTASGSGTIVNWSVSVSVSAGTLYVIKSDGGWTTADADSQAKSTAMAAIALGTNATAGMLLQGFFYKSNHGFAIGEPLYISNTAGAFSNSRPTGTGDYVRIIGYATSTNYIYFDPDKTWVKID